MCPRCSMCLTHCTLVAGLRHVWAMQVLYSEEGYTYLDVRPKLEFEEVGRVKGSVNIPLVNLRRVWDPEQKKKIIHKEDNEKFIEQVSPPSL